MFLDMSSHTPAILDTASTPNDSARHEFGSASIARIEAFPRLARSFIISDAMVVLPVPPLPFTAITVPMGTFLYPYAERIETLHIHPYNPAQNLDLYKSHSYIGGGSRQAHPATKATS